MPDGLLMLIYELPTPGWRKAIQVLSCGHKIDTGKSMRMFKAAKGQLTECPQGCGPCKTARVESTHWDDA